MTNLIVLLIIAAIVGGAGVYIYRAKKRGVKCIGCPAGKTCGRRDGYTCVSCCASCSSCAHHQK
ncbi:MAG: FeoB-associated Cys-rich membrane protein [Clostridiales bacterium]|nr:FeoB-associated Cys-rich membrane protein [Clostridiales bacterium]